MRDVCRLICLALIGLFRSRASLQAEILTPRDQLNVLRRKSPQRLAFTSIDRLVFAGLYRLAPGMLDALKIVRPETVIRWHRAGFRAYWRWKSRPRSGRPKTPLEIRQLIREISLANPLWGAPRLHGELLMLGIDVGQTTVAKYMARGSEPPSQGWKTFLHNHADGIASMDLFVVPTISFRLLYGLLLLHHDRRQILWLGVTAHPTVAGRLAYPDAHRLGPLCRRQLWDIRDVARAHAEHRQQRIRRPATAARHVPHHVEMAFRKIETHPMQQSRFQAGCRYRRRDHSCAQPCLDSRT